MSSYSVPRLIAIPVTKVGLGSYAATVSEDHLSKFSKARDPITWYNSAKANAHLDSSESSSLLLTSGAL